MTSAPGQGRLLLCAIAVAFSAVLDGGASASEPSCGDWAAGRFLSPVLGTGRVSSVVEADLGHLRDACGGAHPGSDRRLVASPVPPLHAARLRHEHVNTPQFRARQPHAAARGAQ